MDGEIATLSKAEFEALTAQALRLCREGDMLGLGTLPLAQSTLVEDALLPHATLRFDERGRALMSVLRWAVERLKPAGKPAWGAMNWQPYLILHTYYIDSDKTRNPYIRDDPTKNPWGSATSCPDKKLQVTFNDLAEWMHIEETTVFARRQTAIEKLTAVLRVELDAPQSVEERRSYIVTDRYDHYPPAAQRLLRLAAIFRRSISLERFYELADIHDITAVRESVLEMLASQWLISHPPQNTVLLHPNVRAIVQCLLTNRERVEWHSAAGNFYQATGDYLEAAYHLREAEQFEAAASLLVQHEQDITHSLHIEVFLEFLLTFRRVELPSELWARIKLLAGRMAELVRDFDTALAQYVEALNAEAPRVRAEACYRCAKLLEGKNLAEALAYYNLAIQILAHDAPQDTLLTELYIHRAWIFIQGQPDLDRAANDLQQAQALVTPEQHKLWADLHNAWGELCNRRAHYEEALEHRLQARVAANMQQDIDLTMKVAHNLGLDYAYLRQYDLALMYLEESVALARQIGNVNFEGAGLKSIGACYFWQGQYAEAIRAYEQAYTRLAACGNRNWQGRVCYDLAEAWLQMNDQARAMQYAQEGLQIAQETADQESRELLLTLFPGLADSVPATLPAPFTPNPRQQQALAYVARRGRITNREYQELTGASARQAARDLAELVWHAQLRKNGAGSGTFYDYPT